LPTSPIPQSLAALVRGIAPGSLDVVLINAGIIGAAHQSVDNATAGEVAEVMLTNAVGPAHAGKLVLPLLREGGTLAFTTSRMGSIADSSGGYELYRMSKAAQNILAKGISEQDAEQRVDRGALAAPRLGSDQHGGLGRAPDRGGRARTGSPTCSKACTDRGIASWPTTAAQSPGDTSPQISRICAK
jgi:NAD(P)-dependent dehydrogenase (short-subunit alcohol dehydrogenase family)